MPFYNLTAVARVCHEAGRAWCIEMFEAGARPSSTVPLPWDDLDREDREAAVAAVRFLLERPGCTPQEIHEHWRRMQTAAGWTHGPVLLAAQKRDPRMTAFFNLPDHRQAQLRLSQAVVKVLSAVYQGTGGLKPHNDLDVWDEI